MKKAIIIIILFSILAITFTATMININKQNEVNTPIISQPTDTQSSSNTNNSASEAKTTSHYEYLYDYEKTLDYYSTYKTPSIKWYKTMVDLGSEYGTREIRLLGGLKDKTVQDKVNASIRSKYIDLLNQYQGTEDFDIDNSIFSLDINAEFQNVICGSIKINDNYSHITNFQIELVNGEEIELRDLFKKDYDLKQLYTQAVYKAYQSKEMYDPFGGGETNLYQVHYDYDKNDWVGNSYDYESDKEIESKFIPKYTEYELSKIINNADIVATIHHNGIGFNIEGLGYAFLYFKNMKDDLVIFDKYATKESIYEDDSLGKRLIVCNSDNLDGVIYQDTKLTDNFFYSATIGTSSYEYNSRFDEDLIKSMPIKIDENEIDLLKNSILDKVTKEYEKFKKQANSNENGYILLLKGSIYPYYKDDKKTNVLIIELKEKSLEYDLKDKEIVMNTILDDFRYRNVDYYGGSFNYIVGDFSNTRYYDFYEGTINTSYYDVASEKFIVSFNEDDAFILSPIFEETSRYYKFDLEKEYSHFQNKYSSDFELAQYFLKDYDTDTLNKAYNEIFARHGHDFKTQSLKEYFSLFDWYKPIPGKTVGMEELSEVERKNAEMIMRVIKARG